MQTRKFFIKVLVRNQSCLNVRTSISEDKGYSLKRDGWITSFTDLNNQSMRDDGVPWRGAREKRPDFFNTLFAALTDKDDIIFDWQCGVGLSLMSPFFSSLSFVFVTFPFRFVSLTFSPSLLLGGSIVACRSLQRHIVALESDIDVFKSILLPLRGSDHEHTSQPSAPQRGSVFAPPPKKMARRNFDLLCEYVCYYLSTCSFLFHCLLEFRTSPHLFLVITLCAEFRRIVLSAFLSRTCLHRHR